MLEKRDVRATGPRNEIDFSNKRELVAKENWRRRRGDLIGVFTSGIGR
jgi:hypothetical protein